MKQEEFRALIEEKVEIINKFDNYSKTLKHEEKNKILKRIIEIDKKLNWKQPNSKHYEEKYHLYFSIKFLDEIFRVGYDNLKKWLSAYFKECEFIKIEEDECNITKKLMVKTPQKKYNLGDVKCNDCLRFIYNEKYLNCPFDFKVGEENCYTLLRDYPDLIDFMWQRYFEFKNQHKKEKIGLVEKMIAKNYNEEKILTNPILRKVRLLELDKERDELDEELFLLKTSLDEIDI